MNPPARTPVHSPGLIQTRQEPIQISQNQRFAGPSVVRVANPSSGVSPATQSVGGPRPNYQIQRTASTNQQEGKSCNSPRPPQYSVPQGPRNDTSLDRGKTSQLSNKENKRSARPRIIIDKMPDLDEEKANLVRENSVQKRKADIRDGGENDDDDDDVVMDNKKSPRQNGSAISDSEKSPRSADGLPPNKDESPQRNGSGVDRNKELPLGSSVSSELVQGKIEDTGKPTTRPGTATIDTKSERKSFEQTIVPKNDNEQSEKETSSGPTLVKLEDKTSIKSDSVDDISVSPKNDKIVDIKEEVKYGNVSSGSSPSRKVECEIEGTKGKRTLAEEMKANENKGDKMEGESKEVKIAKDEVDRVFTKDDRGMYPSGPSLNAVHSAGQNDITLSNDKSEEKTKCPAGPSNNLISQNVDQIPRTPSKSPSPDIIKENKRQTPPMRSPSNIPTPVNIEEASKTSSKSPSPLDVTTDGKLRQALNDPPIRSVEQNLPKTPGKSSLPISNPPSLSPSPSPSPSPTPSPDVVMEDKRKLTASPSNNLTMQNLEQDSKTPSKSSDISRASTPTVVDAQTENKLESINPEKSSRPMSALSKDSTSEKLAPEIPSRSSSSSEARDKLSVPESLPTPPKSPQEGVKGFDNGQRRSLSSPGSPKSPKSAISMKPIEGEKKKTTFAEDSIVKKDENVEEKSEASSREASKPTTPTGKPRRVQTPVKLQNEKQNKGCNIK